MNKRYTYNSYIHTKNVQTVQNLYKVQTEKSFKLEMYAFVCINNVKTIQNLQNLTETAFVCFCIYTQCTNHTKCIQTDIF